MIVTIGSNIVSWQQSAPQFSTETQINSLAILGEELYGGGYNTGKLGKWNGTNGWVEVAPQSGSETITCMVVLGTKLYAGTYPNGKLLEFNGTNAWVEKAGQLNSQTEITSLAVFNGEIYGGTSPDGKLFKWNATNAWTEVAPKSGSEEIILSLCVFNSKLYGSTSPNGKLLEFNGTNAWVEKAPKLSNQTDVYSLVVYNGKLYGGTGNSGLLFEWNNTDAWLKVVGRLDGAIGIKSLVVHNSKIYGGTTNGKLFEWYSGGVWTQAAAKLGDETSINSIVSFGGKIFGGTYPTANLYSSYITPVNVKLDTLQIEDAIGERTTCSFITQDFTGTANYTQSQPVEVTDNGVTLFSGFIEKSTAKKASGNSTILHSIYCKDMHYLSDKRVVAKAYENTAAGTIVTALITEYLADEGVTAGTIQAGPTLVEAIFNYVSATKALESLAEKAGFIWYIDYDRKLYFMSRETVVAPWTATGEKMLDGTVTVENGNYAYRNTQFVRGGKDITDTLTETRIGDGVATAFTVGFPIALVPTITLNAGAQTVGIRGVDTGKDWYWSKGSNVVSQDEAGTILTSSDSLVIEYKGEFDVIVKTLNKEEITRLVNAEASSGIVENVADETNSTTREAAFEVANSKLQKYGVTGRRLRFSTLDSGLFAGQILTVVLPEHGIDTDLLIEAVSTVTEQGTPIYEVTASEGPEQQSWQMLFANLATKNTNQTIFENISEEEVLITLSTFTKTWVAAESPNIFTENYPSDTLQPSATTQPSFELDERVLYVELLTSADVVLFRQQIIKQTGTTTLNSINYVAPYESIGTIAKIRWYGGSTATATNGTGTLVDEQVYSNVKTAIEALQLDKTDTKWV